MADSCDDKIDKRMRDRGVLPECAREFGEIKGVFGEVKQAIKENHVTAKEIKEMVIDVRTAVLGNGKPEQSHSMRLATAETKLKILGAAIIAIPSVIVAIMVILKYARQ